MTIFGEKLTQLRKERKLSQRQLAEALGTVQSNIGNIEAGRGNPSLELACRIAAFFEVTLDSMTADSEKEPELEPA